MRRNAMAAAAVVGTMALALTACGGSEDPQEQDGAAQQQPAGQGAFPATIEAANGRVTLERAPQRIVSLTPTATETLFAIGAGGQVTAVDEQSTFPPEAPRTDLSGFQPNLEAIVGYRPDLVVVSDDGPSDLVEGLEKLSVPVVAEPAAEDLDEAYEQIAELGTITGNRQRADEVVEQMRARIEELIASVPRDGEELEVFHELGPDLFTATSETFIGSIYERLGVENIADEAQEASGNEYPQLSAEYVVSSSPDIVVIADNKCCDVTPEQVAQRPGWKEVAAVRDDAVIQVNEDIASRWGPRIPQFVERMVEVITTLREDA